MIVSMIERITRIEMEEGKGRRDEEKRGGTGKRVAENSLN